MEKTALLVIDGQQEYFAPIGKLVLPDGPRAVERIADLLAWARARDMPVVQHESRRSNPTTFSRPTTSTGHLQIPREASKGGMLSRRALEHAVVNRLAQIRRPDLVRAAVETLRRQRAFSEAPRTSYAAPDPAVRARS